MRPWLADSGWVLFGRVAALSGGLAAQVTLARLLTPEDLGRFFVWSSVVGAVSALASFGIGPVAMRHIAMHQHSGEGSHAHGFARGTVRLGALCGLGSSGLLFVAGAVFTPSLLLPALAAGWTALLAVKSVLADVLRGFRDIRAATIITDILGGWLGLLGLLALAALLPPLTVANAVVGLSLGLMAAAAFGLSALRQHLAPLPTPAAAPPVQWWWRQSSSVWMNTGLWLAFGQMDLWILSLFRSPAEVAVYGLASRLSVVLNQPELVSRAVLMPRIAPIHAEGKRDSLQRMVRSAAAASGAVALLGTLALALGGDRALSAIFGPTYRASLPLALILAGGQVAGSAAGLGATTLLMTGHQSLVVRGSMAGFSCTLLLLLVLVPIHGATGAATATALGMVFQNLLMLGLAKRSLGIWTAASVRPAEWRTVWRLLRVT